MKWTLSGYATCARDEWERERKERSSRAIRINLLSTLLSLISQSVKHEKSHEVTCSYFLLCFVFLAWKIITFIRHSCIQISLLSLPLPLERRNEPVWNALHLHPSTFTATWSSQKMPKQETSNQMKLTHHLYSGHFVRVSSLPSPLSSPLLLSALTHCVMFRSFNRHHAALSLSHTRFFTSPSETLHKSCESKWVTSNSYSCCCVCECCCVPRHLFILRGVRIKWLKWASHSQFTSQLGVSLGNAFAVYDFIRVQRRGERKKK